MQNKLMYIFLSLFFIITISHALAFAQTKKGGQCLDYEPTTVNLKGNLIRKAVINASDQKENIWVLKLNNKICVTADSDNEINTAFDEIEEVQLVFNSTQISRYRKLQNQKVSAFGKLFAGHT